MNPYEPPDEHATNQIQLRPSILGIALRMAFTVVFLPFAALISALIFVEYGSLYVAWTIFFLLAITVWTIQQWLFSG